MRYHQRLAYFFEDLLAPLVLSEYFEFYLMFRLLLEVFVRPMKDAAGERKGHKSRWVTPLVT
jgi:hypothetical protein